MIEVMAPFRRTGRFFKPFVFRDSSVDEACLPPRINTVVAATGRETNIGGRRGC